MSSGAQRLQSWDLTSVDLCHWLGENNAWESPGPFASVPTVKAGLKAVPATVYFVNSHNGRKGTQWGTIMGEQLQWRNAQWLLSQCECSNPAYLTPQIRNTAKKQIWGPLLQQLGSRPCSWQGSDNHREKGRPHSISRAGSYEHNTNQTPYQGDNGTSLWTNLIHQGADTRSKRNYGPAACRKEITNRVSLTKSDDKVICCRRRSKIKTYKNN